ncbi:Leucine-rich repeat-containing protein 15 [Holothuria leucospilota]|uniref:Leucine-rich repeat-containing protein 15 n=1 Tax=Holothuria leucospilota TaxID=206669 RepID=A0A9Q1CES1_HOLLE|nr:Leucine-rich repeat-containing protein 15 [Holothuria leucospilota]
MDSIDLSSNNLADVPEKLLSSARTLNSFHISDNKLTRLPAKLFDSTPELENVSFSSNLLETIPEFLFNTTPNLKMIDFVYNRLTELPVQLFANIHEIKYLQMSANKIERINKDMFNKVLLMDEMDFSNNSISHIPDGLFTSNEKPHKLKTLFLQRNHLTYIQKGAFDGLPQLSLICLFDNKIEAIDDGAFSLKNLNKIFLFNNVLQRITNNSFANDKLEQIHLYGNNITDITNDATKGLISQPTWFLSCELLQNLQASNITIKCFNHKFAPEIQVDEVISSRLKLEGFVCVKTNIKRGPQTLFQCSLCKPGTYAKGDNRCYRCPRGGFYQDAVGVKSSSVFEVGCKRCNNGTFVNFKGGASAEDCQVCPEGTHKNMTAGFRACSCKDGYARTDRFGPCYRCNQTGLNCRGLQDYQSVMKGYYWYWHFKGADNEEYRKFVKNLLEESENFDNNTFYSQQIPRVHRCPRPDSCNTNQTGDAPVRGTCSEGYTGWLCNKCSRGYFSLLQKCIKCPSTLILLLETFFTTVLSVTICYVIWTQYVKHKKRNSDERNLLDIIVSRFKISLGFYQVLGEFFSSIKDVRWVGMFDFMGEVFSYIRLNVLRIFFRPQCFDESLYINPKVEFVIALVIIFSLTVIPFFFYHTIKIYLKFTHGSLNIQSRVKLMKAKISTISLVLLFVTYPPICTAIFQIYDRACEEYCADLNNKSCRIVLRSDFALKCTDLGVYRVFAYVATAAYTVAFPIAVYYLLRKYCAPKMTETHVSSGIENDDAAPLLSIECDEMNIPIGLKFLCENYKPQFWYWEIVELTRKVTQTALLTLLGWEDKLTVLLTIGVSVLFLTLHARYRPMKSLLEQRLQMFSLSVILINVLVAAMAMTVPDQYEQRLAIIILLLNISVIVILMIEAVLGVMVQMKRLQFYRRIYDPRRFRQSHSVNNENTEEE